MKWEWLHSEITVWSEKYHYAGTLDWYARATPRNGAPYVILGDTKTGKSVYSDVGMQISALHFADYGFDKNGDQFELPKAESFGVLHVRPRGATCSRSRTSRDASRASWAPRCLRLESELQGQRAQDG